MQYGACDYSIVLVYDISRWGRFQDVDESAYYEFLCKTAGITIHYCADSFDNNNSLLAAILKSVKRAMAAEYSRELSAKVFAGQCRLISRGYRSGGMAGFGLRRLVVDQNGNPKVILESGERKCIHSDRIVLVPGPPDEVATVRKIFDLFVRQRLSGRKIANYLNGEGIKYSTGGPWTFENVFLILKNEKYIGNNVFNRRSHKLYQNKKVKNPSEQWIRANGCFEPIVDQNIFFDAKRILFGRKKNIGDKKHYLDCLLALLKKEGRLTLRIIDQNPFGPKHATYQRHFGGMHAAYRLIGYRPSRVNSKGEDGRFVSRPARRESNE